MSVSTPNVPQHDTLFAFRIRRSRSVSREFQGCNTRNYSQDRIFSSVLWVLKLIDPDSIFLGRTFQVETAGYFDSSYPTKFERQHLGVDLRANIGTRIYSHITGVLKRDGRGVSSMNAAVIISSDGLDHVFGHVQLDSGIRVGDFIDTGNPIGRILLAGTGAHLHYGLCKDIDAGTGFDVNGREWGWGRAPFEVSKEDASRRGWLDPTNSIRMCFEKFRYVDGIEIGI